MHLEQEWNDGRLHAMEDEEMHESRVDVGGLIEVPYRSSKCAAHGQDVVHIPAGEVNYMK